MRGLRPLEPYELALAVEETVAPLLAETVRGRGAGHCMRVSDLDRDLMLRLCTRLREEVSEANIVILSDGRDPSIPPALGVSATKLVELRNPEADGRLRPPLLAFVPSELRTAAEDSFGTATFEELTLGEVLPRLRTSLLEELPTALRGALTQGLGRLRDGDEPWPFADDASVVRWLLTAKANGADPESYGGALYEIGLVPDFELFADPATAPGRLTRNRDCMRRLTWSEGSERARVSALGLAERAFRNQLGEYLADAGLLDPRGWTRQIVLDRNLWPLAFHRWAFEDGGTEPEAICIQEVTTDLPVVPEDETDPKLSQLIGQQILPLGGTGKPGGLRKFSVGFAVDPAPSRVQGLARFAAQVISRDHGPVGLVRTKQAWKTGTLSARIGFTRLTKVDWEEGWHFVRVLAQTEDGELVPLADIDGNPLPWAADSELGVPHPNESELFYVLPESEVDVEPPQRATPKAVSVTHAQRLLQFTAISEGRHPHAIQPTEVQWAERRTASRVGHGSETIEAHFGRDGRVQVPVSRVLKQVEQKILAAPDGPVSWRLAVVLGEAGDSTGEVSRWPSGPECSAFLQARAAYFAALRADTRELITQGADLSALRTEVFRYASAYVELLQTLARGAGAHEPATRSRALSDLRRVLTVDAVTLAITDHRDRQRNAVLMAPTHPLRALWLVVWAELGRRWLDAGIRAPNEFLTSTREALLEQLGPVAFPPMLPNAVGSVLTAVENLSPFWSLYARSCGSRCCRQRRFVPSRKPTRLI